LVRVIPAIGRKAAFIGGHAAYVEIEPTDKGRAWLEILADHAGQ